MPAVTNIAANTPLWLPALLFFGGILLAHVTCQLCAQAFTAFFQRQKISWAAALVQSMRRPILFFIWVGGFILLSTYYAHNILDTEYIDILTKVLQIGLVIAITWSLFVFVDEVERNFFQWKGLSFLLNLQDVYQLYYSSHLKFTFTPTQSKKLLLLCCKYMND